MSKERRKKYSQMEQREGGYFFSFYNCVLFATYEKTLRYEKIYNAIVLTDHLTWESKYLVP